MPTRTEIFAGGMALFAVSLGLLAIVALLVMWQRWRERPPRSAVLARQSEATRHLASVQARAAEAERRLEDAREQARMAEQEQADAWQDLVRAQRAHEEAVRARRQVAAQRAARAADVAGQRELTHAAFAAYRRGDLTRDQLLSVSHWVTGWDAEMERHERDAARLRGAHREAQLRYRVVASRGRAARDQVHLAEVEAHALADEAAEAAREAAELGMTP